jgi:LacI family transcriptional regulator
MSSDKEVTIYDIARKLNISAATVSRGLQDHPRISKKTKKMIFDVVEQLGYRSNNFARNLRSQKTNTIGVIIPRLNSFFMSSVIAGMENVANKEGYNLIISQSSESEAKEAANAKTMFNNRVDGLMVSLSYDTQTISHFDQFFKKNIPLIFFDRVVEHPDSTSIIIDNRKAAYEATKHLIDQGCRRIVHLTAPPLRNVYTERLQGYKQALADHNIPFNEAYVLVGDLSQKAGHSAAEQILELENLPDGVFAANDTSAVACMLALKKKGIKIPRDIAFVGFNNDPIATVVEPNLSTVNYSGYEMGEVAARHLINHLLGISPINKTLSIVLRANFIERASSQKNKH